VGILVKWIEAPEWKVRGTGTARAPKIDMHATFFQKVILCAIAGFFAASLIEWAKVFVEGADDALNKGYKHRAVIDLNH
jgi:hypothetical protein